MDIERLKKAIAIVRDGPVELSAQSLTYLRTYQSILDAVAILPRTPESLISQVAVLAYGWMPRVARLDPKHYSEASVSLVKAAEDESNGVDQTVVSNIAECLHSVVGASKVLHFVRPDVYPIWDSKVAKVWNGRDLSQSEMSNPAKYVEYTKAVHDLAVSNEIDGFLTEFKAAYSERLAKLNIADYQLGTIRAIESAIFELSGGEYEDA